MLGIVILNYNTYGETVNCVKTIRETYRDPYRIYIVDNCSTDNSFNLLIEKFGNDEDVEILKSDRNGGFSYGNNIGFKKAVDDSCEYILCTNSDVLFKQNSIQNMLKVINADPKCGVVGPKVYREDGSVQDVIFGELTPEIFLLIRKPFRIFDVHKKLKKYFYVDYDYKDLLKPAGMVSGCCFIIRSEALVKIGYFDENVFLYHEENILGALLKKFGYYVALTPDSEIVHLWGKATGRVSAFTRYHKLISGLYYLWNYTDASRRKIKNVYNIFYCMFLVKSIFSKEYRRYKKDLKKKFKEIINSEKRLNVIG